MPGKGNTGRHGDGAKEAHGVLGGGTCTEKRGFHGKERGFRRAEGQPRGFGGKGEREDPTCSGKRRMKLPKAKAVGEQGEACSIW